MFSIQKFIFLKKINEIGMIKIYTDASFLHEENKAGWGAVIKTTNFFWYRGGQIKKPSKDIQFMEFVAIVNALAILSKQRLSHGKGIALYSDSDVVIKKLVRYERNGGALSFQKKFIDREYTSAVSDKFIQLRRLFGDVKFSHVKAHTNGRKEKYAMNRSCDYMAKICASTGMSISHNVRWRD